MTSHSNRIGFMNWIPFSDPLDALQVWCVRDRIAADLVTKHSVSQIHWQLAWMPYRIAKNPSGLLVKAIADNFPRPGLPAEEVEFVEHQLAAGNFPLPSLEAIRASDASLEKWKELQVQCERAMRGSGETAHNSNEVCAECGKAPCDCPVPF